MSQRTERIDELLRQEITSLLTRDVADPRIGFATVTDVETSPDLRYARVWVSVIGQKGERDETIAALNRAMPFVRRELGHRLRLRRIPEFQVRLDDSLERGTRVLHLLQEIEEGQTPDDEALSGESLPTPLPRLPHEGDGPPPDLPEAAAEPPRRRSHRSGGVNRPVPRGSRSQRRR
jgi:ribosome-binding factor A